MPAPPRAAPSGAPCGKMGTTPLPNPSHGEANSNSQADTPAQEESQSCKSRSLPALLTLLSFLLKTVLIIPERSSGQAAFPASSFPAVPAAERSRSMSDPPRGGPPVMPRVRNHRIGKRPPVSRRAFYFSGRDRSEKEPAKECYGFPPRQFL